MSVATIIMPNRSGSEQQIFQLDLETLRPGCLPTELAGPFKYRFEFDTGAGPVEYEAQLLIGTDTIHASFEEYPVMALILDDWTTQGQLIRIGDTNKGPKGNLTAMKLKASLFGKSHIWLTIQNGSVMGGLHNVKDRSTWSLPFYNFYHNGEVCMGGVKLGNLEPLQALNYFLAAITTPHNTYETMAREPFKPNRDLTQMVAAIVPQPRPFDYPLSPKLFSGKTIATLIP